MPARYWVGGTGTWGTGTTNWAATSGGAGGETAPGTGDDVFIDSESNVGTGAFTITISGTVNCASLTVSGLDGTLTMAGSAAQTLRVYGNFSLSGTNITWSGGFKVELRGTGTHTFDQGGRTFTGTSQLTEFMDGTYTLASNFSQGTTTGGDLFVSGGTFDTGNYSITTNNFSVTGTNTKTINLGSSTITIGGTVAQFNVNATGTTFNAGTSTILMNAAGADINPNGVTLYNIETLANTTEGMVESSFTCNNFTVTETGANYAVQQLLFSMNVTVTVNGTFTATGRDNLRRAILAVNLAEAGGTWPIINAAAVSLSYVDFNGLTFGGGATWSGTSVGDYGNNIGLIPEAPKNVYLVGTGAVNWNTSNIWALSSGASGLSANIPLPQDTLIIDQLTGATSLSGTGARPRAGTLDCSTRTSAFTLNASGFYNIKDKLILGSGITTSGTVGVIFRGNAEIDAAGISCATWPIFIRARNDVSPIEKVKLLANLEAATIQVYTGYYDLNGYQSSNTILEAGSTTTNAKRGILFGGGELVLRGTGDVINGTAVSNFDFPDYNNGTIRITSSVGSDLELVGTPNPSWPTFDINTTAIIDFEAGGTVALYDLKNTTANASITFASLRTFTFENFNFKGTSGNLATIRNSVASGSHTLSKSSGIVSVDYIDVQRSTATGGASWYAGANSTDSGNNTGWLFTAAPIVLTGNNVTQQNTSSTGAVVIIAELTLTGNNVTQQNTSSTGAVAVEVTLTGNDATQNNTSSTGAIIISTLLAGNDVTQNNTSTAEAVTVLANLSGANVTQNNTSGAGAIVVLHTLTGNNVTQNNGSTTGAITLGPLLAGNNVTQINLSSTGAIEIVIKERAPAGAGYSPLTLSGSQWSRPQQGSISRTTTSIRKRT
jgi:hypothetical protein